MKDYSVGNEGFTRGDKAALLFVLGTAAALRAWGVADPFIHPLDSAFQESLALNHLKYGLSVTRGLATMAVVDGHVYLHAAHPPLLQLLYAGLYSLFGVHEWVSRMTSLAASLVVVFCLWASLGKVGRRRLAAPAVLAFALMPLAVRLGGTTNYEPVALALISAILLAYLHRSSGWGRAALCLLAVFGGLFEWTVCLAFPALGAAALLSERRRGCLKPLVLPSLCAAAAVAGLFAFQYKLLGHAPVLGHAAVRSAPSAMLNFSAWRKAGSLLKSDFGAPLLLVLPAGLAALIFSPKGRSSFSTVTLYFTFVPLLFLALAPQLVLSHPIARYYLAPLFSLAFAVLCGRGRLWRLLWMMIFSGVFLFHDAALLKETARFHYDLARLMAQDEKEGSYLAFDSSAVGYMRYYHGVETIYPVGGSEPPPDEIVSMEKVRYFIVDTANPEVDYVRKAVEGKKGWRLEWRFAEVDVWKRAAFDGALHFANHLGVARLPEGVAHFWEKPSSAMLDVGGGVVFGVFHHPLEDGDSTIVFDRVGTGLRFETTARLDPAICDSAKTDGVGYTVAIVGPEWNRSVEGEISPLPDGCQPQKITVDLNDAPQEVAVKLTTRPLGHSAYDRFFWEDPRMVYEEE